MTKKRPFFERIVSMLLVAVMAFGMLPMSVFAEGSGGSGSETVPGNKYDGTFVYSAAYGSFTRFTLVEINIPDDDSTLHEPHSPDPGLNPNSTGEMFQDYGLVNRDTYKVIGSVYWCNRQ